MAAALEDFDWSLKLVLASSSLSGMRRPLLQLRLTTTTPDGPRDEVIELNPDELDTVLKQFEAVRGVTRQLQHPA